MTRLADLVAVSSDVTATASRSRKVEILAALLRRLEADEVAITVGLLSGSPRQGKVGVGWSTIYGIECEHATQPSVEIRELDALIDLVQATTGMGSAGRRRDALTDVLCRATAAEADFVRRLFTGELRQGALAGLMVDAVARAADAPGDLTRRAFMLSGDLTRTAEIALTQGEDGLRDVGFEIFRPVLPMLASTADDVATAMAAFEQSSVEWKLDGIRIQVHRRGDDVRIYTRNLNDVTQSLGAVVAAVRALRVVSAVLDGEAIGYGPDDQPATFQDTMAGRTGISGFLFDVLHLDGDDLLDSPLTERFAVLERVAPALRIPGAITSDPSQGQRVLYEALGAGHEGVVVKDASSTYAAGRRGKAWRKVKPVRTFDLVVLAAEWGHGRRQGWLSNLHLGARGPDGGFVMVGKCFKGLTDELLAWQTQALLALETHRTGITVWVRPELVVEIALDGVQVSTRYPGGIAMRFARVRRYRPDKSPAQADTIEQLQALRQRA